MGYPPGKAHLFLLILVLPLVYTYLDSVCTSPQSGFPGTLSDFNYHNISLHVAVPFIFKTFQV